MLSYCEYGGGKGYLLDAVSPTQQQLLYEFSYLGIIYLPSITSKYFYPTRAAVNMIMHNNKRALMMSDQVLATNADTKMTIITETNSQVIAYVTNELHFHMLQLFVDVQCRLPGMAVGRLTREKARSAFNMGISAAQIIEFLLMHSHPVVSQKKKSTFLTIQQASSNTSAAGNTNPILIPENIIDQLVLWENETHRLRTEEVIVIDMNEAIASIHTDQHVLHIDMYNKLIRYVKQMDLAEWYHADKYIFAVTLSNFPAVQKYSMELGFT